MMPNIDPDYADNWQNWLDSFDNTKPKETPVKDETTRYLIKWVDRTEHYTHVYAKTEEEAKETFLLGGIDSIEPTGFCETEYASIEISEEEVTL